MMRKFVRFRKLYFILLIFSFVLGILVLSVKEMHSRFPSLPQQRRIQSIFKQRKDRSITSPNYVQFSKLFKEKQDINSFLLEKIKRTNLGQQLSYANNFSLPLLGLPHTKLDGLAYGLYIDTEEYLHSLRINGQIEQLPSGGERIRASPHFPVRFPSILKNKRPEDWQDLYRIYLNLTFYPWWYKNEVSECSNFTTVFAPAGSLSPKALASFPSSGNSWVRQLIESSSGLFTGSMYEDKTLMRNGMYGEGVIFDSGMTIAQKTHGYTTGNNMLLSHFQRVTKNHLNEFNSEGILIIRNPFRALISHRHLDAGGHFGYAPDSHFIGQGWRDFVLLKIKLWKEFYIDWIENSRPQDICIMFYEELSTDVLAVIKRLLKFLSLPIDNKRLECVLKYSKIELKRNELIAKSRLSNSFTTELKLVIFKAINELDKFLIEKLNISLPAGYKMSLN